MTGLRLAGARWRVCHALTAIAASLAVAGAVPPSAAAQDDKPTISAELAGKKASMLEMFLSSRKLSKVLLQFPDEAGPLVEAARVHLITGLDLLDGDEPVGAAAQFDKGIGAVSQAMALSAASLEKPAEEARRANDNRLREVRTYLGVLARATLLEDAHRETLTQLQARLQDIEASAEAGDEAGAWKIANEIYPQVVRLVTSVQQCQTGFVSKTFATPEEALEYERARHENHRLLVRLALSERAEFQPGLNTLAANLSTLADRLRDEAEAHATAGRSIEAVETMQRATERLSAVLRAAGLIVSESAAGQ